MRDPTPEQLDQINRDLADCVLDHIRRALEHFGVPRSDFTGDQFNNFVAMYNRRGDAITQLSQENQALRERVDSQSDLLVTIANWPNPDGHPQLQAVKVWAASVVDPSRVTALAALTSL